MIFVSETIEEIKEHYFTVVNEEEGREPSLDLGAVHMKIVFPLFSRLTGKKILFPRVHIRNISPLGRDLFWWAVRWENFERTQYSKWVT